VRTWTTIRRFVSCLQSASLKQEATGQVTRG